MVEQKPCIDENSKGRRVAEDPTALQPASATRRFVFALSAALLVFNSTSQLLPRFNALYMPLNLSVAALLAWVASRVGLGRADLGLQRSTLRAGLSYGATVATVVAVALAIAVLVPALHPLFEDERIANIGPGLLAYRALIRIPLGTALFEEFAFRGVLFGAWRRIASPLQAAAGSSLVFGLWHVRPTIDLLEANELAASTPSRLLALAAAVLLTAAAGYLFCLLRIRSRSLIAPFVAHAAINSLAIIAAFVITAGA